MPRDQEVVEAVAVAAAGDGEGDEGRKPGNAKLFWIRGCVLFSSLMDSVPEHAGAD